MDAAGALLLPGLHDHHVHIASYAASLRSVFCGPPEVSTETALIKQLNETNQADHWFRGIGYHESVAGDIDRRWLDAHGPQKPVRIQHRTGRLWILNSPALEVIRDTPTGKMSAERRSMLDVENGRLYDVDDLLREVTRSATLPIAKASENLASFGVTGINDMTASNDLDTFRWFSGLQDQGVLLQKLRLSGTSELSESRSESSSDARLPPNSKLQIGETKIHLHESDLPDFYHLCRIISSSHGLNRAVAVHCVTETELVFTLAALREAGIRPGDRIEHASVVPPDVLEQIREVNLCVVTQPNFILDRGETYLEEIPENEHLWLYRCQSLIDRSVPLAFGTDLPFGNPDPWVAIKSATLRQTGSGDVLGKGELMTAEAALSCFLGELERPAQPRSIAVGEAADFCLLNAPWHVARLELSSSLVRATILDGELIYQRKL
ncbi:MAG: amidohydrolase family protein [bacterium]